MAIKAGGAPGEEALGPFGTQKLFMDEKPKNLAGEELT